MFLYVMFFVNFRILWTLLFLTALAAFSFYLVSGLLRFYTYPISTNMEYKLHTELDFPSVTLCNYNGMRKSFIESFDDPLVNLAADLLNPFSSTNISSLQPQVKEGMRALKMDTIGAQGAHQREDMFIECDFKKANHSHSPCQFPDDLLVIRRTQLGYCYTFHPQSYVEKYGTLVSARAGEAGGLYFRIDIQQNEYMISGSAAGMRVRIMYSRSSLLFLSSSLLVQQIFSTGSIVHFLMKS